MHIGYWWESQKTNTQVDNIKMDIGEIGWGGQWQSLSVNKCIEILIRYCIHKLDLHNLNSLGLR
jgi:hypothetical protein